MGKKKLSAMLIATVLTSSISFSLIRLNPAESYPKETEAMTQPTNTTAPGTEPSEEETVPTEPPATSEPVETTVPTEATEYTAPPAVLYDVPLSEELQRHIISEAGKHGIDPAIIFAMAWRESSFRVDAIGNSGEALGLLQIIPKWNQDRMDRLNCQDLLDPFQNVTVGVDLMAERIAMGKGMEWALMSYNGGISYADGMAANGKVSEYALELLWKAEELRKEVT